MELYRLLYKDMVITSLVAIYEYILHYCAWKRLMLFFFVVHNKIYKINIFVLFKPIHV